MDDQTGLLGELLRTPVRQLSSKSLLCLPVDTPVGEAVRQMQDDNRGAVIVTDEGRLAGIFTEHDVLQRIDHHNPNWNETPLGTLMSENPERISSGATLGKALQLMRQGPYRHLPMIKDDGEVLAVLSIETIVTFIADCFPEEFINLPPSQTGF